VAPRIPACRGVDPGALGGQLGAHAGQHGLESDTEGCPGDVRLHRAGHRDMGMGQLTGRGGHPLSGEVLDLRGQHLLEGVEPGAEPVRPRAQRGIPAPGPQQAAAECERGQRADGETAGHQIR
jgi:hypothetical protein